uniref:Uncharacterized protein n=1 Tax=Mimiviridae sp. ChoanoV1 TaxID=2596887 RepID=A0A5B8IP90_9VIRU|nr:hypothetical protein 1_109 [Mimiviridae sp. ChoanoV1]
MSSLNTIYGYFSGITINNNNEKNILSMHSNGNFNLKSNFISNYSYKNIINYSDGNSEYKSKNGNLSLKTELGNINIKNGDEEMIFSIKDQVESDELSDDEDDELLFVELSDIFETKKDSLLIESLKNKLCLYSNYGIESITHMNHKIISDNDIICQALKKIRLNSMGSILLNSNKIISSSEEDIIFLSNFGDINFGGDGYENVGLKINNNNKVIIGNNSYSNKKLNINLNQDSKSNFDGLSINSSSINPQISLKKNNILLDLEIGKENNSLENSFFAKLNNNVITILDNFEFCLDDIENNIEVDTGELSEIISFIDNKSVILNNNIDNFDYKKCYVNRNNCAVLKTKTPTSLHIGSNNIDILNFSSNGRLGINTKDIEASCHISNNYGKSYSIKIEKDKKYFNHKTIQLNNSNFVVICNSFIDNMYYLELFLYNIENILINHIIINESSYELIDFDVILFKNNILLSYCIFNQDAIYVTNGHLFNYDLKKKRGFKLRYNNQDIEKSSKPLLNNFTGSNQNGFIILYRDNIDDKEIYFTNIYNSKNELILNHKFEYENEIDKVFLIDDKLIYKSIDLITLNLLTETNNIIVLNQTITKKNYLFDININNFKLDIIEYKNKSLYKNDKILKDNIEIENLKVFTYKNKTCASYISNDYLYIINEDITILKEKYNGNYGIKILKDTKNIDCKILLFWEVTENDEYYYDSICFKELLSNSNLLKINNKNNDIQIKDNGDILINDLIELSKQKNTTKINSNLILSPINNLSDKAQQGQINHYNDELFIFLGNKWKKIRLEDI